MPDESLSISVLEECNIYSLEEKAFSMPYGSFQTNTLKNKTKSYLLWSLKALDICSCAVRFISSMVIWDKQNENQQTVSKHNHRKWLLNTSNTKLINSFVARIDLYISFSYKWSYVFHDHGKTSHNDRNTFVDKHSLIRESLFWYIEKVFYSLEEELEDERSGEHAFYW